jgi:tetratricopeptide (TPR) repeat protein
MKDRHHTAFLQVLKRNIKQWIRQSDWSRVVDGLEELKQIDPLTVATRGLELEYLLAAGHKQAAQALAQQLVNLFPASSRIHYLVGQLAYRQKNYSQALAAFEESHSLYPHWRTERYIGKALTQSGDFEKAEPILVRLIDKQPLCLLDLAWLYERQQHCAKAQTFIEQYLHHVPEDAFAKQQLQRLQARVLSPEQVLEEVQALVDFDQPIPIGLLSEYTRIRLAHGEGVAVRQWVMERLPEIDNKDALQLGWLCYQLKVYDLAFELFVKDFAAQYEHYKYRAALELSAERGGQLIRLVEIYEQYVETDKRFYGRVIRLKKKS